MTSTSPALSEYSQRRQDTPHDFAKARHAIDAGRQVVATAQVAEQGSHFVGQIDLGLMPVPLQQLFTEYEEIVSTHIFSLLDAIEKKISRCTSR